MSSFSGGSSSGSKPRTPKLIKRGNLTMRAISGRFGYHPWKSMTFTVDDSLALSYFKPSSGKLRGQIVLTFDTVVAVSSKKPHAFSVKTPYVTMHAHGQSDQERDEWMETLKSVISVAKKNNKSDMWDSMKSKADSESASARRHSAGGKGTHVIHAPGTDFEIDKRYTYIKPIGQGAYGVVIAANDSVTGQPVAIKKINGVFRNVIDGKRILREVKLLGFLKHKHISNVVDLMRPTPVPGQPDKFDEVYIVLDLMDTDLHRVIYSSQSLSDAHVQYLLFQMLSAIYYLQTANVIHRDLKPSNILVNSKCELRVCDFGLARGLEEGEEANLTEYVVTRWYRAPELLLSSKHYTSAIDMWSVGCIFAELLGRRPLFAGDDYLHQLQLICDVLGTPNDEDMAFMRESSASRFLREQTRKERKPWKEVKGMRCASEVGIELLNELLMFDPSKRMSAADALKHPYLKTYHSQELKKADGVFDMDVYEKRKMNQEELRIAMMGVIRDYRPDDYPGAIA